MDEVKISERLSFSSSERISFSSDGLYVTGGPAMTIRSPQPVTHTHDVCGGEVFAVSLMREYDNGAFWATGEAVWVCMTCGIFVAPITKKAATL